MKTLTYDVGGTQIKHCVITDGKCGKIKKITSTLGSLEEYLTTLRGIYDECEEAVDGIAMSVPGMLDNRTGYMYTGGSCSFISNMNFAEILSERCDGTRVALENDAKAAGMAELRDGALKEANNGYVLTLGTGIGGCTIVNRKILRGANQFAGEFSYIISKAQLDIMPSMFGMDSGLMGLFHRLSAKTGEDTSGLNGVEFFHRADAGEAPVLEALHEYCHDLVIQIMNLQAVIDPDVVAIGGGISAAPLLHRVIQEELDTYLAEVEKYFPRLRPHIVPCTFRNEANLLGAYYNFADLYGEKN